MDSRHTDGGAPRISVVVAAHNEAGHIRDALLSVARQTRPADETVVVDDGSTDGTADLVAREFPSCRLLVQPNRGPGAARNAGVAAATGEWVAFLDADDAWFPWTLAQQDAAIRDQAGASLWCGAAAEWSAEPPRAPQAPVRRRPVSLSELMQHNPVVTSTVVARRTALDGVGGFDEHVRGPEDFDLWLRLAARDPLWFQEAPLARRRMAPTSLSMRATFLPQVLGVIDRAFAPGGACSGKRGRRAMRSYQYLAASWAAAQRGERRTALVRSAQSFLEWPFPLSGRHCRRPWARLRILYRIVRAAAARPEPQSEGA